MGDMRIQPAETFGRDFIPAEYLPKGADEYYLRNAQAGKAEGHWRSLRAEEIEALVKNANTCGDWDSILVAEQFNPHLIKNCEFSGLVRIGRLDDMVLCYHELELPVGITNSRIIACDIGDNTAIHDVRYLAHYIIGDHVMLANLDEMHTTNHAKFGNGIVKDGEDEKARVWLDLINETGGRAVMPFDGMTPADAYIWARFRADEKLMARLAEITQKQFDSRRGFYGTVGDNCVIKNSRIIKDVKVGPCCYIKGANKLKNLTVNSSEAEPTQIGEGVEMVNGIVGYGCHIFYGCKAVRFVMCNNTNLKYGARLIHSVLGDNSTVSCCEILHNLVFPAHEQHHNNSFLTASLVRGQSNLAAGATVGSNHNSRANDGEIHAGRGFWPGLCVTLKHSCRFVSFVLLSKGDYPAELNIELPFSLLNDDVAHDRLVVMPAFWWMYDMYALARNTWKFQTRDKRKTKTQNIEFDSLAPDTAEEICCGMRLLEIWTAKAAARAAGSDPAGASEDDLAAAGRKLLLGPASETAGLEVLGERMEKSSRKALIVKAREGYHAYRQMLHYYAMKNLLAYMEADTSATLAGMCKALGDGPREREWDNLGGQLIPVKDIATLLGDIKSGKLADWGAIHAAYDSLWSGYGLAKQQHAFRTLLDLLGAEKLTDKLWTAALDEHLAAQEYIRDQVFITRKKDYDNFFRQATFHDGDEQAAVIGTAEGNSFVKQVRAETDELAKRIAAVKKRS